MVGLLNRNDQLSRCFSVCHATFSFAEGLESLKDTIRSRVDADRGDVTPANHAVGIDDEQAASATPSCWRYAP